MLIIREIGDWVFEYKTKEQVLIEQKEAVGKTIRN